MMKFTRRQYLIIKACEGPEGNYPGNVFVACEAVSSVAIEHPEWDMDDEQRTWDEWEKGDRQ